VPNQLIIRFHQIQPGMDPDLVSWAVVDENGQHSAISQGSLDEIDAQPPGSRVVVIVAACGVVLVAAAVPTQNKKRLMAALPFALEDQLISDVEDLHFALGTRNENAETNCVVVDRDHMDRWTEKLKKFNIKAHFIVPDVLAVPYVAGSWSVLVEENNVLIRTDLQSGFSVETDNAKEVLNLLLKENSECPPELLYVYRTDDGVNSFSALSELSLEIKEDVCADSFLPLIHGLDTGSAINLLQGDYSRREQLGKVWRPWLPAAAMCAGLVFLQLATTTVNYFQLKSQSDELKVQIKQVYLNAFPGAKNVVNPRVQMTRKLKALRGGAGQGGSSALALISGAAPVFKSTAGLEIKSVRYKDGKLNIDLIIKDLQTLDSLKQKLVQNAGMRVDIVSANSRNNKVESRLKIQSKES